MAIPESQLDTWSKQGSIAQSSSTYNTVKKVLEAPSTPYTNKNYSVFLQGSYGNHTNIYAESDVDIVIKLDDCFQSDLSDLSEEEKNAYAGAFDDATYTHNDFKRDVIDVLSKKYSSDVKIGSKAVAIAAHGNRRKSDVIIAIQFRRYFKFKSTYNQSYEDGICFYNSAGERIPNYPKQHSGNLTKKNQSTNQWLKPMIRIFKNMRSKLEENGLLGKGIAPSYYLEGLLFNVPDSKFTTNYQTCFVNAMNWIQNDADKKKMVCANKQYYLLWENSYTSWPEANCEAFLNAAIELWNDW